MHTNNSWLCTEVALERGLQGGAARFTLDGAFLYAPDAGGFFRVWDSANGRLVFEYPTAGLTPEFLARAPAGDQPPALEHVKPCLILRVCRRFLLSLG